MYPHQFKPVRTRFSGSSSGSLLLYSSPRHPYYRQKRWSEVVISLGVCCLLLLSLGVYKGVKFSASTVDNTALLDPSCPKCTHGRNTKALDQPNELNIKLGRREFHTTEANDRAFEDVAASAKHATREDKQQQQQQLMYDNRTNNSTLSVNSSSSHQHTQSFFQQPHVQQQVLQQQQHQQQQREAAAVSAASADGTFKGLKAATPAALQDQAASSASGSPTAADAASQTAATVAVRSLAAPAVPSEASVVADPLQDIQQQSAKEALQLAALSRVVQQQQDTISRQAKALMDLQKRFAQQERQLEAATASAAATNTSEALEQYLPEARVQQELDILHKVEAQIEEISLSVAAASAMLPKLDRRQQANQQAELDRAEQLMGRLSRVAAAISLRTSDPLTEGGHDPVAELRQYYGKVASNNVTMSWREALSRQSRPSAASLGLEASGPYSDAEDDLETLDLRLEYALTMMKQAKYNNPCSLALVATWSGDLWGLRRELIPWLTYHAQLGVSKLYVLYEGGDTNTLTELRDLAPYATIMLASAPLASTTDMAAFNTWVSNVPDSHIKEWREQPGNYHLMTKQGFAVTKALELAKADNISWLIHIDPDELLHPGAAHTSGDLGGAFSLLPELCGAPDTVPSIRFVNVEGVPEAADLHNRYEQVTLFRAHRHLVPPGAQPYRYVFKQGHAQAWLHLYTNGKSAVRPNAPGAAQGGPHVYLGPAHQRWVTSDNPHGMWHPVVSNSTIVLHYAYASPRDVAVKAGRSCPPDIVQAALDGDTDKVSKCFVLELDQRAFLAAIRDRQAAGLPPVPVRPPALPPGSNTNSSQVAASSSGHFLAVDSAVLSGSSTSSGLSNKSWPVGKAVLDFFWGELALSEGAPFECLTPDGQAKGWCAMANVSRLKSLLISSGLTLRLHAPSQAMKGIEAAIQQLMLLGGRTLKSAAAEKAAQLSEEQQELQRQRKLMEAEKRQQGRMQRLQQQQRQQQLQQQQSAAIPRTVQPPSSTQAGAMQPAAGASSANGIQGGTGGTTTSIAGAAESTAATADSRTIQQWTVHSSIISGSAAGSANDAISSGNTQGAAFALSDDALLLAEPTAVNKLEEMPQQQGASEGTGLTVQQPAVVAGLRQPVDDGSSQQQSALANGDAEHVSKSALRDKLLWT